MRTLTILASALTVAGSAVALAQPKPAGGEIRYFMLSGELMGELPAEAIVKETRQGGKVVSAEIDLCYSVTTSGERKDRVVVALKGDGQKFSGTGQTTEEKQPVTVNLWRKPNGKTVDFEGTISRAGNSTNVASPDNAELTEAQLKDALQVEDGIVTAPADFSEVSPASLAIKIKREAMVPLVTSLRSENVTVAFFSLVQDCAALRTGEMVLRIDLDPERAPALLAKLKSAPGVLSAGWGAGVFGIDRAVRFPAAGWRDGGKLNRDKLGAAIGASVAKVLKATVSSVKWDESSGEVTLEFKRPSQLVAGLNLTDVFEMSALLGPDKPGTTDKLIVWLGGPTLETVDEASGAHLKFTGASGGGDEEGPPIDNGDSVTALAKDLKGQVWDADKSVWK